MNRIISPLTLTLCLLIHLSLQGCRQESVQSSSTQSDELSLVSKDEAQLKQVALIGAHNPNNPKKVFRFFKNLMGTRFYIQLIGYDQRAATVAARAAFNEVDRIERLMSSWRDDSEIGALNLSAGDKGVTLSAETAWLLCQSKTITQNTYGAFDVTWAALKGLWNFKVARLPKDEEIKKRLAFVGIDQLSLHPITNSKQKHLGCELFNHLTLPASWTRLVQKQSQQEPTIWSQPWTARLAHSKNRIDLGGIAKGFGIDQAARVLQRFGYQDFLIDGGGDLFMSGRSLDESPWSVGIAHPRSQKNWGKLWIPSGWSVVTSGDYERYFFAQDQRYHHIIDLRTGYPARASVAITVIARSAMLADAYATALFVLGPDEGRAIAEMIPDLEAIFFTPSGEVIATEGAQVFSHHLPSHWK